MGTHFSGPVTSAAGFVGDLTGSQVAYAIFPTATDYSTGVAQAIAVNVRNATLSKTSAGTYTVAAPGASYVGYFLLITSNSAYAHTVTVTGLNTSTAITLPAVVGSYILLLAVSATAWILVSTGRVPPYGNAQSAYSTGSSQAVALTDEVANLSKAGSGGTYTLAAPGAANVNRRITIYISTAYAHVITVTGLLGGTTLTFTAGTVGLSVTLLAVSATVWIIAGNNGATQTA
jgi:hypothetical protein